MKATQQKFKISVEQEILYGKLLKESAIAMGQVGRLPEFKVYQATNKLNNQKAQAYQIIKNAGVINALQLAEKMNVSLSIARNIIQKLIRDNKVERVKRIIRDFYPYSGYKIKQWLTLQ